MPNSFYVEPANPLHALMLGVQGFGEGQLGGARSQAGELMASGDLKGALAKLYGVGDIQGAALANQMYQQSKPIFTTVGTDQFGNPIHGFANTNDQSVKPAGIVAGQSVGASGAIPNSAPPSQGLTGEDFLKTLPPEKQAVVKAIAEGRSPFPSGFLLKTPYGQWLQQAIGQYKPGYTAQDFSTMAATAKAFDVGPEGRAVKAANQAVLHAQTALDSVDKLGNYSYLPGVINPVTQAYKSQFDPQFQAAQASYRSSINALAGELTKAFRGNSGAISDIEHWRQSMSETQSPEYIKSGIQTAMKLLGGAVESLGEQRNKGMKSVSDPYTLLDPKQKQIFDAIISGGKPNIQTTVPTTSNPPPGAQSLQNQQGGPARPNSKAEYDALPRGTLYIPPDGSAPRTKQ